MLIYLLNYETRMDFLNTRNNKYSLPLLWWHLRSDKTFNKTWFRLHYLNVLKNQYEIEKFNEWLIQDICENDFNVLYGLVNHYRSPNPPSNREYLESLAQWVRELYVSCWFEYIWDNNYTSLAKFDPHYLWVVEELYLSRDIKNLSKILRSFHSKFNWLNLLFINNTLDIIIAPYDLWVDIFIFDEHKREFIKEKYKEYRKTITEQWL